MPLNIDWQQILLHMFNVTLLFAILYFLLYKPVHRFMDERTAGYEKMKQDAKDTLSQAEKAKAEYASLLNSAQDEIDTMKQKASREAADNAIREKKNAEKAANEIINSARSTAQAEKKRIIDEAQGEITDMIAAAAERLVSKTAADAYDEFLKTAGDTDE